MKVTAASRPLVGESLATALSRQASIKAAAVGSTSTLTWETFIPESKLDAPTYPVVHTAYCTYGTGYQFGGDNHGFDWRASSHRTSLSSVVTWSTKADQNYTSIGTTHVYKKSTGALVDQRTASGSQTYSKELGSGSNYVDIRMVTHASNPFCPDYLGAIDGAFTMHLTQSGNYSFTSGDHRQMPDHYVYLFDAGVETNVYEATQVNPACLFGAAVCDLRNFDGYGSF